MTPEEIFLKEMQDFLDKRASAINSYEVLHSNEHLPIVNQDGTLSVPETGSRYINIKIVLK